MSASGGRADKLTPDAREKPRRFPGRALSLRVTLDPNQFPLPLKLTGRGVAPAAMFIVADLIPVEDGVNVT